MSWPGLPSQGTDPWYTPFASAWAGVKTYIDNLIAGRAPVSHSHDYEATGAASAAVAAHVALADPHSQYETSAEAAAKVSAHVAAVDPHGDRAYTDAEIAGLATVATTGAYADLSGTPSIPDLNAHLTDTADAHDASAISATGFSGNLAGETDVQGALDVLDAADLGGSGASASTLAALQDAFVNGQQFEPQTMGTPPTLALSAAGASTAVSGAVTVAANNAAFTYLGASMSNVGTLGSFANCYRQNSATLTNTGQVGAFLNVEFETDDDDFEVILRSEDTTYSRYRVWVNGQPAAAHAQVGTSGSFYRLRVTFASTGARRIRVEGQAVTFAGIAKRATRTIWQTVRDTGAKAVAVTDSYGVNWDGATASTLWVWDNYVVRAGRYLGWNVYPSPVGGTGFTADNGAANVKFGSRLTSDVTNLAPEIVVVAGSYNDNGQTLGTVQTDVNSYFSSLRSALPNATIYALGGVRSQDSYTNMATISGYISTAASANTATFVDSIGWITGTGRVGSTTGVGNSDFFTAADAIHLSADGYTYISERLAAALGVNVRRLAAPSSAAAGATLAAGTIAGRVAGSGSGQAVELTAAQARANAGVKSLHLGLNYSIGRALVVETDVFRWYNKTGQTLTIDKVWAQVGTAPTGASLIVDVHKDGTTIFTTQGNRPTISASGFLSTTTAPAVTTVADGSYLTFDVDQIGSTIAGSYLTISMLLSVA